MDKDKVIQKMEEYISYLKPLASDDPNNGILDNGQNSHNEVKCPISWADDQHYFHFK